MVLGVAMQIFRFTLARIFRAGAWVPALAALFLTWGLAHAAPAARATPDLADTAAGTYHGEVISDAEGESQANVDITVVKIAPNQVRVTSNYPRLPAFSVSLTKAMNTIQQAGGATTVFLLDLSKQPNGLHV